MSFEQLFAGYRSSFSNDLMTQEQNQNLHVWHEKRGSLEITLSQADNWMMQAGLIRKKILSVTDTGTTFSKLKKFSLNEEQFLEYLEMLAKDKSLDLNEVKTKLLAAGLPKVKNNEEHKQEEEEIV